MENIEKISTTEKIEEALVDCLKEKIKIEDLTVAYLAKKAGVGKSTFYRHYKDIYDVYEQLVDGFIKRCENLIIRIFFKKNITFKQVIWIFIKNGPKKDNELFYARDVILINHSIEKGNAKVVEMLYDKMYELFVKVAKKIGIDDETAAFGSTFFLNGNIIPILSNLHAHGKIQLETVTLTFELFEMEVERWRQQQQKI